LCFLRSAQVISGSFVAFARWIWCRDSGMVDLKITLEGTEKHGTHQKNEAIPT
jgi:hypothetical protein